MLGVFLSGDQSPPYNYHMYATYMHDYRVIPAYLMWFIILLCSTK